SYNKYVIDQTASNPLVPVLGKITSTPPVSRYAKLIPPLVSTVARPTRPAALSATIPTDGTSRVCVGRRLAGNCCKLMPIAFAVPMILLAEYRVTNLPTRYQLIVPCTVPLTPVSVAVKLPDSTSATSSDDAIGLPPPQESVPPPASVPRTGTAFRDGLLPPIVSGSLASLSVPLVMSAALCVCETSALVAGSKLPVCQRNRHGYQRPVLASSEWRTAMRFPLVRSWVSARTAICATRVGLRARVM